MKRRMFYLLLWVLGFASACDKERETVCMYGTPRIDARAKGRVTAPNGAPVPGIDVRSTASQSGAATDADGRYDLSMTGGSTRFELLFTDPDGPANGGEFESRTMEVAFTEADKTADGDGAWDRGGYERANVDVTLREKE